MHSMHIRKSLLVAAIQSPRTLRKWDGKWDGITLDWDSLYCSRR